MTSEKQIKMKASLCLYGLGGFFVFTFLSENGTDQEISVRSTPLVSLTFSISSARAMPMTGR